MCFVIAAILEPQTCILPNEVGHDVHDVNAIAVGYDRVSYIIRGSSRNLIDNKT